MKSLYDISWKCDEESYRKDPAYSYSTLAKFNRGGFHGLKDLFEPVSSPSLAFGSAVDTLITDGEEAFVQKFTVADFDNLSDTMAKLIKGIHKDNFMCATLDEVSDENILRQADINSYYVNLSGPTRVRKIRNAGSAYYEFLNVGEDKQVLSPHVYDKVIACVNSLRTSPIIKHYFGNTNIPGWERLYQLKFKTKLNGIDYRIMADEIIVDHKEKTIQMIDLKTSSHYEDEFYKSFIQWDYQIQARLYARVLSNILRNDDYFKDFIILQYQFVVVNKDSLVPLVWKFPYTFKEGDIVVGKNNSIILRDPEDIAKELDTYLKHNRCCQLGVECDQVNDLSKFFDTL